MNNLRDDIIDVGKTVRTTPQYESLYWGKRMQGEVVNYDFRSRVVTFLCNGVKEMLNEYWLMAVS